ncbi:unnamed protein product [Protopolystoma xenopodis]|uniref:Uncharacterized protein n=1 Tax=Protopolystoma xenopodis TaxID=117903 RepID=A0A448WMY5_9PLAT|nr:unnamed protein product [Protopolystoma xenopodis]
MLSRSNDARHLTDKSLAPFYRNRRRLPGKQRQYESSSKAKRQLVKRNPPSSSGRIDTLPLEMEVSSTSKKKTPGSRTYR